MIDLDALERAAKNAMNASGDEIAVITGPELAALLAELRAWRELYPDETPEQAAEHYVS